MKKRFLIPLLLLAIILASVYLFIPATVEIAAHTSVHCTKNELVTSLHSNRKWASWFPEMNLQNDSGHENFYRNSYRFMLSQKFSDGAAIVISKKNLQLVSHLQAIAANQDSILLNWKTSFNTGPDPITRIERYIMVHDLENTMQVILDSLAAFSMKSKNVYGFNIERSGFEDKFLIAARRIFSSDPGIEKIYAVIHELEEYLKSRGASQTSPPMFHLHQADSLHYNMMVAIPIDKLIPESKDFFLIRMVHMNEKFVSAEVKGGPGTIKNAHNEIERFMSNHMLTMPAIPFEILISDRFKIKDTSKWITKIYYPST